MDGNRKPGQKPTDNVINLDAMRKKFAKFDMARLAKESEEKLLEDMGHDPKEEIPGSGPPAEGMDKDILEGYPSAKLLKEALIGLGIEIKVNTRTDMREIKFKNRKWRSYGTAEYEEAAGRCGDAYICCYEDAYGEEQWKAFPEGSAFKNQIAVVFQDYAYDPVADWLESIEPPDFCGESKWKNAEVKWKNMDSKKRAAMKEQALGIIQSFYDSMWNHANTNVERWAFAAVFCGVMERASNPGCAFRTSPMLFGAHRCGKSSFIKHLLPPSIIEYYAGDFSMSMSQKDRNRILLYKLLAEWPELQGLRPGNMDVANALATATHLAHNKKYREETPTTPVGCILIPTRNETSKHPRNKAFFDRYAQANIVSVKEKLVKDWEAKGRPGEGPVEWWTGLNRDRLLSTARWLVEVAGFSVQSWRDELGILELQQEIGEEQSFDGSDFLREILRDFENLLVRRYETHGELYSIRKNVMLFILGLVHPSGSADTADRHFKNVKTAMDGLTGVFPVSAESGSRKKSEEKRLELWDDRRRKHHHDSENCESIHTYMPTAYQKSTIRLDQDDATILKTVSDVEDAGNGFIMHWRETHDIKTPFERDDRSPSSFGQSKKRRKKKRKRLRGSGSEVDDALRRR